MAIFQPILGNLRGSVGANTFSHNRGGDYLRRRSAPTNKNSTRQQTMRNILATFAQAWSNGLDAAQRQAWTDWAGQQGKEGPLGNSINLSGINGFIWVNSHLRDAGDPMRTLPPAMVAPEALETVLVDISAATTGDVTFTLDNLDGQERLVMFMSLPQAGAAQPNFKQCRIVGYSDLGQGSPWAATLPFPVNVDNSAVFFVARYHKGTGLFSQFLRAYDTADF